MERQRVLTSVMSAMLAAVAGPAWAQSSPPDQPATSAPGTASGGAVGEGDFEGSDVMQSGELREDGAASPGERPWAEGVSAEDQARAQVLFKEGNELLRDSVFPQAVKKYREALALWDHPGIHFNLALALLNLEQPIAVHRSLEKAMKYGPAPLGAEKYERAQSYFDLVSEQLGTVEITVNEPGAKVTLDGKLVLTGPGTYRDLVLVGEHQVVASKREYVDAKRDIDIEPNETERLDLVMYSVKEMTVSRRRWATWKPWAVVGAGAFVLAAGSALHAQSNSSFQAHDEKFTDACPNGCTDDQNRSLTDQRNSAERMQQLAVTSYIVGGTAAVAGLVLVFVNRPEVFRRDLEGDGPESKLTLVPVVTPDSAGVSASFRF